MTMTEYAKVTSVLSDDAKGGQLVTCLGMLSGKNYQKIELMSFRGVTGCPRAGDYVLVISLSNNQYVAIGGIEQKDLGLDEGEVMLYTETVTENGQVKSYTLRSRVKMTKEHEVLMETLDASGNSVDSLLMGQDGVVTIDAEQVNLP